MENEKKMEKAQVLADTIRKGDVVTCEDCLDFLSYTHDDRMEVLEALAAKKKGKKEVAEEVVEEKSEPTAEDGCDKCKKKDSKAKDEVPPPPPPEEPPKKEEPAAPAATPAAPAAPAKVEPATPPAPVEPPKEPVGAEPVKDATVATVTTPSISAPLAKVEGPVDGDKKEPKAEDTIHVNPKDLSLVGDTKGKEDLCPKCGKAADACDCGAKEPKAEDGCDKDKKEEPVTVKEVITKTAEVAEDGCGGKKAEDCGAKEPKTEDGGITKVPMGGPVPKMPEKETFGESKTAMDGISPEVFATVAAECDRARKLAAAVGQMGITIDSAGKREIEVAREAVKQIPSLAFAVDSADEQVLMAVRGAIAARADELARAKKSVVTLVDTPAVVQDAALSAPTSMDLDRAFAAYFK